MPRQWRRSEELQKSCASSANLFAFICGPPWAWINGSAVLTELNIEHGLTGIGCQYRSDLGCRSHGRDRLPRKYKLADVNRNAPHSGDQDMIPATGIEDQELSVAPEGPSVNDPAITRGCDLRAGPGCQRNAFFDAARTVGTAKFANFDAIDRQSEQTLGGRECDRRTQPGRVLQPAQIGLAIDGVGRPLQAGCGGGFRCALQVQFHLADQALKAVDLFGEGDGARAFGLQILLDPALLALALVAGGGGGGV